MLLKVAMSLAIAYSFASTVACSQTLYVPQAVGGCFISVVNTAKELQTSAIPFADQQACLRLAISSDNTVMAASVVSWADQGYLEVINPATKTLLGAVKLSNSNVANILISPDDQYAIVTEQAGDYAFGISGSAIDIVDLTTLTIAKSVPFTGKKIYPAGEFADNTGKYVYVDVVTKGATPTASYYQFDLQNLQMAVVDPGTAPVWMYQSVSSDGTTAALAGSDTTYILDIATLTTRSIAGLEDPWAIALSADANTVYECNGSVEIGVLPIASGTFSNFINLGTPVNDIALSPSGAALFASLDPASLAIVDVATEQITSTVPVGDSVYATAVNSPGAEVFAMSYSSSAVLAYNLETLQQISPDEAASPLALALGQRSDTLFTINSGPDFGSLGTLVNVVDLKRHLNVFQFYTSTGPVENYIGSSPSGDLYYLFTESASGSYAFAGFDARTGAMIGSCPIAYPSPITVSPDGKTAYLAFETLVAIDLQNFSILYNQPLSSGEMYPPTIAPVLDSRAGLLYLPVSNYPTSALLDVFEASTGTPVKELVTPVPGNMYNYYIAKAPGTDVAYIADEETIYAFNTATGETITQLDLSPSDALSIQLTTDGGRLIVFTGGQFLIFDTTSNTQIATIQLPGTYTESGFVIGR